MGTSTPSTEQDLFCRIVAGEVPSARVYEDDLIVGFLDHRPVFKGHVLLVPRQHAETIDDLPPELMTPLLTVAQRVGAALREALGCQGSFMAINNVVSQSVPHVHLHVIPRTKGDGLRGFFWPRTKYADGELEDYAARIAAALTPEA